MRDRTVDDEHAAGSGGDTGPGDDSVAGLDEPTLVARAQDGDLAAFEALVDRYQGPLFRLARRMLTNRTDAEDVVQDSLIAIWRRLPLINDPQAFGGWAYKITTNRCLDLIKQRQTRRTDAVAGDDLDRAQPDRAAGPAQQAQLGAEQEALAALLQTLPPRQRACWLLREVHGRSYTEIAGILSITETVVRGQLARARAGLAKGMSSWR